MAEISTILALLKEFGPFAVACVLLGWGWLSERKKLDAAQEKRIAEAREMLPAMTAATKSMEALERQQAALLLEVRARQ